jgi:hypothetical protein
MMRAEGISRAFDDHPIEMIAIMLLLLGVGLARSRGRR